MKIVIAGGSGFIGKQLTATLQRKGHEIIILTRKRRRDEKGITYVQWLEEGTAPEKEIENADAIVNLAGVSINDGRWSAKHQSQIYDSRMAATEELARIIFALAKKPSVLINASAIGIYPASDEAVYTEDSLEIANDFLGRTVHDWEKKAERIGKDGIRTVMMRFGVVLGKEGGALPLMSFPYRWFVGGRVGSGEQWVSWVHITDVVRAIEFAIENRKLRGPVNVTGPSPLRMGDFGKTIASILHRPHWLPVPSFALKVLLGQKSSLVLEGQNVRPNVLINEGFEFSFPTLRAALQDLLR